MLRLYPIRYRHLPTDRRFRRYDLIELRAEKPRDDHRPESLHVDEDSIRIISKGKELSSEEKVRLWKPFIAPSLKALHAENKATKRSFGIVRPDPGSMKFFVKKESEATPEDRAMNLAAFQQASMFEEALPALPQPEYAFGYQFTSDGHPHRHCIHDWEVQQTVISYRRRYGPRFLDVLRKEYGEEIPKDNPHFIMGTMKAHPQTFIIIGILRSQVAPSEVDRQSDFFR